MGFTNGCLPPIVCGLSCSPLEPESEKNSESLLQIIKKIAKVIVWPFQQIGCFFKYLGNCLFPSSTIHLPDPQKKVSESSVGFSLEKRKIEEKLNEKLTLKKCFEEAFRGLSPIFQYAVAVALEKEGFTEENIENDVIYERVYQKMEEAFNKIKDRTVIFLNGEKKEGLRVEDILTFAEKQNAPALEKIKILSLFIHEFHYSIYHFITEELGKLQSSLLPGKTLRSEFYFIKEENSPLKAKMEAKFYFIEDPSAQSENQSEISPHIVKTILEVDLDSAEITSCKIEGSSEIFFALLILKNLKDKLNNLGFSEEIS